MKRLISTILCLCIILTCSVSLAATTIKWNEVKSLANQLKGEFFDYDDAGIKVWIPEGFTLKTSSSSEEGVVFEVSGGSLRLSLQMVAPSQNGLQGYMDENAGKKATSIDELVVNGYNAIAYVDSASKTQYVIYELSQEKYLLLSGYPSTDENFANMLRIIVASLQAK